MQIQGLAKHYTHRRTNRDIRSTNPRHSLVPLAMAEPAVKVAVITTAGCRYCKAAKQALQQADIAYSEYELSEDVEVLKKVKSITGRSTVPQIFIGGQFFGGADDLSAALKSGAFSATLDKASPDDPPLPRSIQDVLSSKSTASADPFQLKRKDLTPIAASLSTLGTSGFTLQQASDYLAKTVSGSTTPTETLKELQLYQLITLPREPNTEVSAQSPGSTLLVCIQDLPLPNSLNTPLNSHFRWFGTARPAKAVGESVRALILTLYDKHLSPDGKKVAYAALKVDPNFRAFVDATAELQKVNLDDLTSREDRLAFFINIYNALVVHALVVIGPAANGFARGQWFDKIRYEIGGYTFSSNDIEHGVLRGNAPSPANLLSMIGLSSLAGKSFKGSDPRARLAIAPKDPRIHFALNCGAVSCPPIRVYNSERLEFGLSAAASAFCAGEVDVDSTQSKLRVSMILKWYGKDFGTKAELIRFLIQYLPDEKSKALQEMVNKLGAEGIVVEYRPYDWSTNSSD